MTEVIVTILGLIITALLSIGLPAVLISFAVGLPFIKALAITCATGILVSRR